jgi:hypothetical protein
LVTLNFLDRASSRKKRISLQNALLEKKKEKKRKLDTFKDLSRKN